MTAAHAARKFGFEQASSDYRILFDDPALDTVFIATPHSSHARMVIEALQAGKHVFVEKPLALNRSDLAAVQEAYAKANGCQLMVGYNRRFSPLAAQLKKRLERRSEPLSLIYTVNAGAIPADHWTQDPSVGGGRIIGEACHFIDLLRFLVEAPIVAVQAAMLGDHPGLSVRQDKMTIMLQFADGSTGAVHYLANGSKSYPKERIEVFSEGRVAVIDNWKTLRGFGWPGLVPRRLWRQDKGHRAEVAAFIDRVTSGGSPLIPWGELEEVTLATFAAVERAYEPPRGLSPCYRTSCAQPNPEETEDPC
jgi:predicted dehydrogenase